MDEHGSVSDWIQGAKVGDESAAQRLWERYFVQLVRLCQKKLGGQPRLAVDEEDVALSAFHSFWQGAQQGRFPQLQDRDDLWRLLVVIAARKAIDLFHYNRRHRRGGVLGEGARPNESADAPATVEQVIGREPSPELAAVAAEEYQRLLACLPDTGLRQVAQAKLYGLTNAEIARDRSCSLRTVERKLGLIRRIWEASQADV